MLLEKNFYPDDFPMNIRIGNLKEYPIHYHHDIEFVFVLKGEIKLKNGYYTYTLKEGDIFTNNGHEVHAIYESLGKNVVAVVQVSNLFFTQYFPDLYKSCYRTYTAKENDPRYDKLKKMLLMILLDYLKKSRNYEQQCIHSMLEFIQYLNSNFNLFAFEDQVVVQVKNNNAVLMERMSRIINYIYENHSEKITLKDLAKLENLNEYYISHLIKEFTGMSFRELLCFARVEWSEIYLLNTDKTIAAIARDVGFSTTAFYETHFIKWFKKTPEEHRKIYAPMASNVRSTQFDIIPINQAIHIIKQNLSSMNSQDKNTNQVQKLSLDISVDSAADPLLTLAPEFEIALTPEDYNTLGIRLYDHLSNFNCKEVTIRTNASNADSPVFILKRELEEKGYKTAVKSTEVLNGFTSFGLDSAAHGIHILKENLFGQNKRISINLIDSGDKETILKGMPSILTSGGIPKPSYYAYWLLSILRGTLICRGKHYAVIRACGAHPDYFIVVFNYNEEIDRLCTRNATIHETQDVLHSFNDQLDIHFILNHLSGDYLISRYSIDHHNNLFDYMSKLNFPDSLNLSNQKTALLYTIPFLEIYTEKVTQDLNLHISLNGLGTQFIRIQQHLS